MKRIAPASLAAPRRAIPTIPRLRWPRPREARRHLHHRPGPAGKSWRLFPGLCRRNTAERIDPLAGVDRAWTSEIGCRFSPHKYADVKQRLPRIARPVPLLSDRTLKVRQTL